VTTTTSDVYFDPFDASIKDDPYETYARLRDEAPIYYNDRHDFYVVSRFADVERMLTDRSSFVSGRGVSIDSVQSGTPAPPGLFIAEDPPRHTRHRAIVSLLFTPRAVRALEPKVRALCAAVLDPLVGAGGFDFVRDIGAQIPMRVIGMLVGIPESDQVALRDRMEASMQGAYEEKETPFGSVEHTAQTFTEYLDWRADHPSDDLMTDLMTREFEDETGVTRRLTREELVTFLVLISAAGNDTTNRMIGWIGSVMGEHPDQRRAVAEDRSLVPNAVEEVLRLEPPPYHIARYVARDAEFHGRVVPAGSALMCLPGAANRDERQFPDAGTCDVRRDIGHTVSFGYGPHFCLGAALARLEGRIVLEEVLERFPDWEIDHDHARLTPGYLTRGWERLPVLVP
jgi:cytochrome P450